MPSRAAGDVIDDAIVRKRHGTRGGAGAVDSAARVARLDARTANALMPWRANKVAVAPAMAEPRQLLGLSLSLSSLLDLRIFLVFGLICVGELSGCRALSSTPFGTAVSPGRSPLLRALH